MQPMQHQHFLKKVMNTFFDAVTTTIISYKFSQNLAKFNFDTYFITERERVNDGNIIDHCTGST